ncbi:hypothetical protein [Paenibacillus wynnii]|uniref:Uncharacterized protein n=1 Tax=Paenibacillus wynnii TaxID=268407 RepID=A0A098M5H4_9BACL|nr:hypothetical protein [Paenibacillus wynnii]KGE16802.1 hypothetical protein PWYN_19100 [Paenibacillus wynnii]
MISIIYIIEVSNGQNKWISGIFEEQQATLKYYDSIPGDLNEYQSVTSITSLNYPFYIVEEGTHFTYLDYYKDLEELLEHINIIEDQDHVYINLYYITNDYISKKPGTDNMGILNHLHIDNHFLEHYKVQGRDLFTRNRIA